MRLKFNGMMTLRVADDIWTQAWNIGPRALSFGFTTTGNAFNIDLRFVHSLVR